MSARDALPTGLALGAGHAPDLGPRHLIAAATLVVLSLIYVRR